MSVADQDFRLLKATSILDFDSLAIQELVEAKLWRDLSRYEQIKAIYHFVKDDIAFGYNRDDTVPATEILADGYGQCNTKATLLMALLRAIGIPCRFHGFTIDKALQKGAVTGIWYRLAPREIIHSWVEVEFKDEWRVLEGVILDDAYLSKLKKRFSSCTGTFCGYGVYTNTFQNPPVEWRGNDTYIQSLGISHDFGVFDCPDDFYKQHGTNLSGIKHWLYENLIRKQMNANIGKIRNS